MASFGSLYILTIWIGIPRNYRHPYILAMGPKSTCTQRLNLAQSFNTQWELWQIVLVAKEFYPQCPIIELTLTQMEHHLNSLGWICQSSDSETAIDGYSRSLCDAGPWLSWVFWLWLSLAKMLKVNEFPIPKWILNTMRRLLKNANFVGRHPSLQMFLCGAQNQGLDVYLSYAEVLGISMRRRLILAYAALLVFLAAVCIWHFLLRVPSSQANC